MRLFGSPPLRRPTAWTLILVLLASLSTSAFSPVLSEIVLLKPSTVQANPRAPQSLLDNPFSTPADSNTSITSTAFPQAPLWPDEEENSYLFGVINDQGQHYEDLWQRGVRATTFEFQWKRYEPQEGLYDLDYINHMQSLLRDLKAQGWYVQMVPGFHYTPNWVFDNYSDMFFVNQFGERYDPDPLTEGDFRVTNAPFNPQARALIAAYMERIFTDFDQSDPSLKFDSVRIGGGVQGELRYPPANWNGHTNSYWAFDVYAQNNAVSAIPAQVQGWRPGLDPNPGSLGRGQLLLNPGFEHLHPGFLTFAWSPDDPITAEYQDREVHIGNYALKITLNSAHRIHQFIRVSPNTTYQFGGWLLPGTQDRLARLIITQYDSDAQPISDAPFAKLEAGGPSWTSVTGSLLTEPDTRFLKVELDGDRSGTYYFDDLWLQLDGETNQQSRDIEIPLSFYEWYLKSLSAYQAWQIDLVRFYFQGPLDLVYAGKGLQEKHITDALTNDLLGDMWSEKGTALYAGTDYQFHLDNLTSRENIVIYLTGLEDPPVDTVNDASPYPGDWSAARWLAHLARTYHMPIWGENSGANSRTELNLAITRMAQNGFKGLMWAFESDLYTDPGASGFASVEDYERIITWYAHALRLYIPVITLNYYYP